MKRKVLLVVTFVLVLFAGMTILVNAAATKDPTVYVNGSGSVELTWKSGKSQTYSSDEYAKLGGLDNVTFIPSHGWHINATLIDEISQDILDEDGFSLTNIQAKSMINVTFRENGGVDDVDTGLGAEAYPDPDVGLIFDYVDGEGLAYASATGLQYPGLIGEIWDIWTTAEGYEYVNVSLVFNLTELIIAGIDPNNLTLWITEVDILRSDLNLDEVIDGADVSIVANANPKQRYYPNGTENPNWNETLDLYDDDVIDDKDVNIVNNYIGESVWEQLESDVWVDEVNKLVYVSGVTDHFSLFGAR